ncbi:uncharacterized protein LOC120778715 [Bactrocera tryoni]|uniref:uncharacterized protein LOC120778715 n=1 Tax=Bactrocera tryoni TaxID=59916 RepID=UPI001A984434|nr:uncharacterized protein LOC120778715 [Bactrocera tryoni]
MFASDLPKLSPTWGLCVLCHKKAEWSCERCVDLYCSMECQRMDWPRHRYICLPMPHLVPLSHAEDILLRKKLISESNGNQVSSTSVEELLKNDDTEKNTKLSNKTRNFTENVILVKFLSSNKCLVRAHKPPDNFTDIQKEINAFGKNAPELIVCPSVGSVALLLYKGTYTRVEVLSIQDDKRITLLYCDYGWIATVAKVDLRMAVDDVLKFPRLSALVILHNVGECSDSKVMSLLEKFEGMQCELRRCIETSSNKIGEKVSLTCGNVNLNEEINKLCFDTNFGKVYENVQNSEDIEIKNLNNNEDLLLDLCLDEPCQKEKPILSPPFDIYIFQTNLSNFKVVVLDTSALSYGYIGCIAETDLKYLVTVQEYLNNYEDNGQFYSPKLHEYCLAKFENEWYRARVVKIMGNSRYTVVYLDFTNESTITSQDIRRYPKDLNGPCRTNLCLIDGLPTTLNADHINFLKKEITAECKLVIDKVKEVVQQIVVVECATIIEKMNSVEFKAI